MYAIAADFNYPAPGNREALIYDSAVSVKFFASHVCMSGFRFRGRASRPFGIYYQMPASKFASLSTGLASITAVASENWYAAFAVGNGDTSGVCDIKVTPFLRVGSVAGSVVNLVDAGEGQPSPSAKSYTWSSSINTEGVDVLVISENGGYSGRIARATAASGSTITSDNVGTLAAHDMLLLAPAGYVHYGYLGSFYRDTAEVRNIYDTGHIAKSKGIYVLGTGIETGTVSSWTAVRTTGYICPLASGVIIDSSLVLSTASTGSYAEYYSPDSSNHTVQSEYRAKNSAANESVVFSNIQVPFIYPNLFYFSNAGTLTASRTAGYLNITGWFEN